MFDSVQDEEYTCDTTSLRILLVAVEWLFYIFMLQVLYYFGLHEKNPFDISRI